MIYDIQGVLGLHEFWARNKFVQAKFVLVKLCTSMFSKIRASEILTPCVFDYCKYQENSYQDMTVVFKPT